MVSTSRLAKILIPLALIGAIYYVYDAPYTNWSGFFYFIFGFGLTVHFAVLTQGWWRNLCLMLGSLLFFLAGAELAAIFIENRPVDIRPRGYSGSDPVLGWGPGRPGSFRQVKYYAQSGNNIFDAVYTIDAHKHRVVASAPDGPVVAFFGDSMTFGTGLNDADTLPQIFADLTGKRLTVYNLAFPAYGPQQMLRALETGLYDNMLKGARLFVYQTAAWHAERAACKSGFMLRAPRYELVAGVPTYEGSCMSNPLPAIGQLLANTSLFRIFILPNLGGISRADIELDIAMILRSGQIAKERYGARLAILYLGAGRGYLDGAGITEEQIMERLRAGGLIVVDARLQRDDYPGEHLTIPGDGHPTAIANRARARRLIGAVGTMLGLPR